MPIVFEHVEAEVASTRGEASSAPAAMPAPTEPAREDLMAELCLIAERERRLRAD